jgi:hypothetical protein
MIGSMPKGASFFITSLPDGQMGIACASCFQREVEQAGGRVELAVKLELGPELPRVAPSDFDRIARLHDEDH